MIYYFNDNYSQDLAWWAKKHNPAVLPTDPKRTKISKSCECGKETSEIRAIWCFKCDTFTTEHHYLVNKNKHNKHA